MRRGVLASALLVCCAVALPAHAATSVGGDSARVKVPRGFVRHELNPYWTWYAPRGWVAAGGANGIAVSSPTGTIFNDYGQGGVTCPSVTPAKWFAAYAEYSRRQGLYSKPLASSSFTSEGKVQRLDRYYWRQRFTWKGRTRRGVHVKGELVLDIFVVDAYSGVCGQRSQNRAAPAKGFGASLKILRAVQSLLFYNSQPVTRG